MYFKKRAKILESSFVLVLCVILEDALFSIMYFFPVFILINLFFFEKKKILERGWEGSGP